MSQGRGSAPGAAAVAALTLIYLLAQAENAGAATYTVGDSGGWTFNMENWPTGKEFRAFDTLIFKYDPNQHNVLKLDKGSYDFCAFSVEADVYTSGNDEVTLEKGMNYFICDKPNHCDKGGMKMAVNVTKDEFCC